MVGEHPRLDHRPRETHRSRPHRPRATEEIDLRHAVARLGQSLIVVFIVTTISFFVIRSAPGDPFSYDSTNISAAVQAYWRHQFGYDRPLAEQFARYLASVARG